MRAARANLAVAVLDGKLYAVGGFGNGDYLNSVERYDPATNAWEAVAPMASARGDHGVAVLDGKLYAVGGFNAYYGHLSSVERYEPATNAWQAVAPMAAARSRLSVAVLDGGGRAGCRPQSPQLGWSRNILLSSTFGDHPCNSILNRHLKLKRKTAVTALHKYTR